MARRRKSSTDEAFQMAPMIDMVFLLLVFFMTVSTIAKDSRPELDLALSTTAVVPETAPPRNIITVRQDNTLQYFWSSRQIVLDDLPVLLEKRGQVASNELILRAGPDLPWEIWANLLGICRQASVSDVVFATFED